MSSALAVFAIVPLQMARPVFDTVFGQAAVGAYFEFLFESRLRLLQGRTHY